MDVRVNLALGSGDDETKVQKLMLILQEQKELMQQGSPLVGMTEYRHTLGRIVELAGFPNAETFFKAMSAEQEQQMQQQQAQQQQQDPQMMAMQAQIQIEQAKIQLDREKMLMEDARKKQEMALDFAMKQATAEAQYQTKINDAEVRADVETAKAIIAADAQGRNTPAPPAPGGMNG